MRSLKEKLTTLRWNKFFGEKPTGLALLATIFFFVAALYYFVTFNFGSFTLTAAIIFGFLAISEKFKELSTITKNEARRTRSSIAAEETEKYENF